MSEAVELEPCPFCGGKAEIERAGTPRFSTIYACTDCGCRLETGEEWGHGSHWNRRSLTGEGEPVEDHEPVGVGKIGNYYGGLSLKREGGVDFWLIENYDGDDWEAIPASLANELRALSASGGGE